MRGRGFKGLRVQESKGGMAGWVEAGRFIMNGRISRWRGGRGWGGAGLGWGVGGIGGGGSMERGGLGRGGGGGGGGGAVLAWGMVGIAVVAAVLWAIEKFDCSLSYVSSDNPTAGWFGMASVRSGTAIFWERTGGIDRG